MTKKPYSKFRAQPMVLDQMGHSRPEHLKTPKDKLPEGLLRFPSKKEANRWWTLRLLEKARQIKDLRTQVTYRLEVNSVKICDYRADFVYEDVKKGVIVVEDVKGVKTDVYVLKRKLMKAIHNIDIFES